MSYFIVKFTKMYDDAIIPTKTHYTDAGFDFYAYEDGKILVGHRKLIKTGVVWNGIEAKEHSLAIEHGQDIFYHFYIKIEGRSGLATKGIGVLGGVIDQDYRGEIKIILINHGPYEDFYFKKGDRIAQGILHHTMKYNIKETFDIEDTKRNANGFGSSGR